MSDLVPTQRPTDQLARHVTAYLHTPTPGRIDPVTTPANPDDLITWLRAQLDTEEAHARKDMYVAQRATSGEWRTRYGVNLPSSWVETESTPVARLDGPRHEDDGMLIQRFRPGNVLARAEQRLAEVDAKRRILDAAEGAFAYAEEDRSSEVKWADESTYRWILAVLALPYADRPGYRKDWDV